MSDSLNKSCVKDPLQQPAATTMTLLYNELFAVLTPITSPLLPDLGTHRNNNNHPNSRYDLTDEVSIIDSLDLSLQPHAQSKEDVLEIIVSIT